MSLWRSLCRLVLTCWFIGMAVAGVVHWVGGDSGRAGFDMVLALALLLALRLQQINDKLDDIRKRVRR